MGREDLPSWLYAVEKGATTLWERWDWEHMRTEYDTNTSLKELNFSSWTGTLGEILDGTSWHEDDGRDAAGACTQSNDRVCKANDSG